jgi:hypothetical protein
MILKSNSKITIKKTQKPNNFLKFYFFFTSLSLILLLIFFVTSQIFKTKISKTLEYLSKEGRIEYIYIFNIAYNAFKSNFYKLDKINLEIKFDDIVTLESERELAIENNSLGLKERLSRVNTIVNYNDEKIKSKIRLKGNRQIHYIKKKHSSYNIYLAENKNIYGANSFGIHKPGARNYIHEWIFNEMMGDFGLIKPKYEFFELYINGTSNGLYAFEEKMGKEILLRNKRINGPILGYIDDFDRDLKKKIYQIYDKKFWNRPENIDVAKLAINKITEFYDGKRKIEDTFNLEKFAAFFAVIDATYTTNALFYNTKLYYDPLTGLFEPIPRDGHRQLPNHYNLNSNYYDKIILDTLHEPESFEELDNNLQIDSNKIWWINKFFTNSDGEVNHSFYNLYLKYLTKISSEKYLEKFFNERQKKIDKINSQIYSDYFFHSSSNGYTWGLYYFKKKDLFYRAKILRQRLRTEDKKISAIINKDNNLIIDIAYQYFDKNKNLKRLDNLNIKSINCSIGSKYETKIIDKQTNIFTNTKVRLSFFNSKNVMCNSVDIIDKKINKNYLVKIDNFNSISNYRNLSN